MSIDTALNYSPNFDLKKRKKKEIKFIIFHYTGMKNEIDSLNKLTNYTSKVSSHFFIKKNGEILSLVPEPYIAWHAGISNWKNFRSLNKYSIGIEISNSGHDYNYTKFTSQQIKSVLKLSKYLIKKYKIKYNFILGHSDIAPERKIDPGEKFPWQYLSKKNIGYWHTVNKKILLKLRNQKVSKLEKINFLRNLRKIGYTKNLTKKHNKLINMLTCAFQRRFRQELINGIIDKECLIISKNLAKKLK
jgi:N-acetylmuramoyl-L-alanine amidase